MDATTISNVNGTADSIRCQSPIEHRQQQQVLTLDVEHQQQQTTSYSQLPPTGAGSRPAPVGATSSPKQKRNIVKVGFYEVERTIGKGNYAVVKLGRHKITKTEVSGFYSYNIQSISLA